jgi:hypothetical protein
MATGWTTEGSEFKYQKGKEFSFLYIVLNSPGVRPTSYPLSNGYQGHFLRG